jgi:hypothetical protein
MKTARAWSPLAFCYDDGGRAAAGFKGTTGDCVCRAIAIATGRPYADVYADLHDVAQTERPRARKVRGKTVQRRRSNPRRGVKRPTIRRYLEELGWSWTPTMGIGTGCKVHLRADELPRGRLIVSLSKHLAAVVDGVLHDLSDCSRHGTRCVYGYWTPPA